MGRSESESVPAMVGVKKEPAALKLEPSRVKKEITLVTVKTEKSTPARVKREQQLVSVEELERRKNHRKEKQQSYEKNRANRRRSRPGL